MSCAFLSCGETCEGPVETETSSFDCPCTVLANGLHAMAQPLTVLRGALGAWKLQGSTAESDRYIEMSARQVERMGDLLLCMRDVLDTADGEPKRERIDAAELIGLVLERMNSILREWGGTIDLAGLDVPVHILGDADRMERAIRSALRVAMLLSPPRGVVRLLFRLRDREVQVRVEQTASHGKTLGFAERLYLSLVKTNVSSQGGRYECVDDPLCILFTLPAYSIETMPYCDVPLPVLPLEIRPHEPGLS